MNTLKEVDLFIHQWDYIRNQARKRFFFKSRASLISMRGDKDAPELLKKLIEVEIERRKDTEPEFLVISVTCLILGALVSLHMGFTSASWCVFLFSVFVSFAVWVLLVKFFTK